MVPYLELFSRVQRSHVPSLVLVAQCARFGQILVIICRTNMFTVCHLLLICYVLYTSLPGQNCCPAWSCYTMYPRLVLLQMAPVWSYYRWTPAWSCYRWHQYGPFTDVAQSGPFTDGTSSVPLQMDISLWQRDPILVSSQMNSSLSVCLVCMLSYLSSSPHIGGLHSQGWESTAGYTFTPCVVSFTCPGIEHQIQGTSELKVSFTPWVYQSSDWNWDQHYQ